MVEQYVVLIANDLPLLDRRRCWKSNEGKSSSSQITEVLNDSQCLIIIVLVTESRLSIVYIKLKSRYEAYESSSVRSCLDPRSSSRFHARLTPSNPRSTLFATYVVC